jgi:hypothetical protein
MNAKENTEIECGYKTEIDLRSAFARILQISSLMQPCNLVAYRIDIDDFFNLVIKFSLLKEEIKKAEAVLDRIYEISQGDKRIMNVFITGIFRGVERNDTKGTPSKERYLLKVEQKSESGMPVIETVTSYSGPGTFKDGEVVSLDCYTSMNVWKGKFNGEAQGRVDFIIKKFPVKKP